MPNFIGFLIITFLPIFATFILSFTEWDGKSKASSGTITISIKTENPVRQDVTIPESASLVYVQREADKRERSITVPYILNEDIVIPADSGQTYGFVDTSVFKQWSSCIGGNGQPILSPVPADQLPAIVEKYDLKLESDEYSYLIESQLFYGESARTLAPRLADSVSGISKNLLSTITTSAKKSVSYQRRRDQPDRRSCGHDYLSRSSDSEGRRDRNECFQFSSRYGIVRRRISGDYLAFSYQGRSNFDEKK
jgi:hypothetical protein